MEVGSPILSGARTAHVCIIEKETGLSSDHRVRHLMLHLVELQMDPVVTRIDARVAR